MHCFACNVLLSNPQLDKPTGRYYCDPCIEPSVEEQLRLAGKDYYDFTAEPVEELEVEAPIKETIYDEDFESFS